MGLLWLKMMLLRLLLRDCRSLQPHGLSNGSLIADVRYAGGRPWLWLLLLLLLLMLGQHDVVLLRLVLVDNSRTLRVLDVDLCRGLKTERL